MIDSSHLSIKFSFFLHGESNVCASVDVRQHPPLWRLQPYHLTTAVQSSQSGLPGGYSHDTRLDLLYCQCRTLNCELFTHTGSSHETFHVVNVCIIMFVLTVILAPYGLAGTLTGQVYKESDSATQKILEEWKQYFVVPDPETWECSGEQSTLPKVVEVIVGQYCDVIFSSLF